MATLDVMECGTLFERGHQVPLRNTFFVPWLLPSGFCSQPLHSRALPRGHAGRPRSQTQCFLPRFSLTYVLFLAMLASLFLDHTVPCRPTFLSSPPPSFPCAPSLLGPRGQRSWGSCLNYLTCPWRWHSHHVLHWSPCTKRLESGHQPAASLFLELHSLSSWSHFLRAEQRAMSGDIFACHSLERGC